MEEKVVRKRAPRRVATKTVTRKAPVRVVESVSTERRSFVPLIAIFIFIVVVAGSIAVGFSDDGQINVSDTITERKTSGTPEEQEQLRNIPVQQTRTALPDGGLVPTSDAEAPVTPPPEATTASSTDTASTTPEDGEAAVEEAADSAEAEPTTEAPTDNPVE